MCGTVSPGRLVLSVTISMSDGQLVRVRQNNDTPDAALGFANEFMQVVLFDVMQHELGKCQ